MALQRNSLDDIKNQTTMYVTIAGHGDELDSDWKVEFNMTDYTSADVTVTDLALGISTTESMDWNMPNSTILEMTNLEDKTGDSYKSI